MGCLCNASPCPIEYRFLNHPVYGIHFESEGGYDHCWVHRNRRHGWPHGAQRAGGRVRSRRQRFASGVTSRSKSGAEFKATAAEVAEACDVVLSMLPTGQSVVDVAVGDCWLIEAERRQGLDRLQQHRQAVVLRSTSSWRRRVAAARRFGQRSRGRSAAGTLRTWASGPRDVFDEHIAVLDSMSMVVVYMGDLGNAKLVKTANAMLAGIMHMSMMEVYTWVTAAGMSEADFEAFIRSSRNFSPAIERVMKIMLSHSSRNERLGWPRTSASGSTWLVTCRSQCRSVHWSTRCSRSLKPTGSTATRRPESRGRLTPCWPGVTSSPRLKVSRSGPEGSCDVRKA